MFNIFNSCRLVLVVSVLVVTTAVPMDLLILHTVMHAKNKSLKIEGAQIIGWVCTVIPKFPLAEIH